VPSNRNAQNPGGSGHKRGQKKKKAENSKGGLAWQKKSSDAKNRLKAVRKPKSKLLLKNIKGADSYNPWEGGRN